MGPLIMRGMQLVCALVIACNVAALPAAAQDVDPKALEQSRKILELTNTQALGEQVLSMLLPQIVNLVAQANPSKEAEVRQLVDEYFEPSLRESLPELLDECAVVYARHFTVEELNELAAFYATPLGQKLIKTQPQLLVDLNQVGQKWGLIAAQRAMEKLAPILRERGLHAPA
jgi:uncharacterized protein